MGMKRSWFNSDNTLGILFLIGIVIAVNIPQCLSNNKILKPLDPPKRIERSHHHPLIPANAR